MTTYAGTGAAVRVGRRRPGSVLAILAASLLIGACVSDPPDEPSAPPDDGEQLLERGVRSYERGDYEAAAADFTSALSYYRSYDLAEGIARSHINLARVELDLARPDAAHAHLVAARRAAERIDDEDLLRRLDLLASTVALERGELQRVAALVEPHLPPFTVDDAPADDASPLSPLQLSFIANRTALAFARDADDRSSWLERLARGLATRAEPPPALEGRLYRFRAQAAASAGQNAQALDHLETALERYKSARNRNGIAATLEAAAELYAIGGDRGAARAHLDRALFLHIASKSADAARANLRKRLDWTAPEAARERRLRAWMQRLTDTDDIDWQALRAGVIDRPRSP